MGQIKDDTAYSAIELVSKIEEMVRIKQPLFVATMNERGQIVIIEWVRDYYNLKPGDKVEVYQIEKAD